MGAQVSELRNINEKRARKVDGSSFLDKKIQTLIAFSISESSIPNCKQCMQVETYMFGSLLQRDTIFIDVRMGDPNTTPIEWQ